MLLKKLSLFTSEAVVGRQTSACFAACPQNETINISKYTKKYENQSIGISSFSPAYAKRQKNISKLDGLGRGAIFKERGKGM